jgi:hypothetical protein
MNGLVFHQLYRENIREISTKMLETVTPASGRWASI